jgi:hypothetical protein
MSFLQTAPAHATRTTVRAVGVAALAAAAMAGAAAPAHAAFGFADGSVSAMLTGPDGTASNRAGSHPDLTVDFDLNRATDGNGRTAPDESLNDLTAELPPGLLGDPRGTPKCGAAEFTTNTCDRRTMVGVDTFSFAFAAGFPVDDAVVPVFNLEPPRGVTARLGFQITTVSVVLDVRVRSDGGYNLAADVKGLNASLQLFGNKLTLWGVPADHNGEGPNQFYAGGVPPITSYGSPGPGPRVPFISAPTRCGVPLRASLRAASWQNPDRWATAETELSAGLTGCEQLPFDPSVSVRPSSPAAGQPSGYAVDLTVPQPADPDGLVAAHLKDATVALPEGVSISPPAASGLGACSDAQLAVNSTDEETCPGSATIGTVQVETPVLDEPLTGRLYLGTQESNDPASGRMYRLFLTAYGSGVRLKLRGAIKADPKTGRLTTTFADNPELPFSKLSLNFQDGPRAPLVNPTTCGTKTTTAGLSSWGGQARDVSSTFDINQGCPTGQFAPGFSAGTVDPFAGRLSPFVMTTTRTDADQDLKTIRLDLPSGLLGMLGKIPMCGDAQAAAGTCGAETRLGSTTVAVGTGERPFPLRGTVSLAGPYKGAPYSLSIAVPAKAGPLDLGLVVVRSPLVIDANKGRASAPVDDLPQIIGGIPMHYRSVSVALDRPGFMFNSTNCSAQTVVGTLTGANGTVHRPGVRYQAQDCDKLKLTPSLKIEYSGKADLKKGRNPKLTADLGQTFGQAGLKRVSVTLPLISTLKPENAEALCTPAQAAARNCPETSIVGRASATTPALHEPLTGPVYFLEGTRRTASGKIVPTLPKLWLKLRGSGVDLDLRADSSTQKGTNRLIATFVDIPDAPIADFKLEIDGGKKGILEASLDPCSASRRAEVRFDGQNGARQIRSLNIAAPECGVRASMNATSSRVRFRFTGIGAGKVTVSGKGLTKRTRTIKSSSANVIALLTPAVRRQVASGRTVKLRLTATFAPKAKGEKTTKITKTVTIKGAKQRR